METIDFKANHFRLLDDDNILNPVLSKTKVHHFVKSGFGDDFGNRLWFWFKEDPLEIEPHKSGVRLISEREILELRDNLKLEVL